MSRYESKRRPELRRALVEAGTHSRRELARTMLATAGATDPAQQAPLLVAYLDGLIFDHVAGAGALALDRSEPVAALRDLLLTFL